MSAGPVLYRCLVRHARTRPLRHGFAYRTYQWLVDLDAPPDPRFRARDHLGDPQGTIRSNVERFLARRGVDAGGRILMLTNARGLGHIFNPLTVYWCHDHSGRLSAVVAEVHNTYGERHCYLLHPDADGRAETGKAFYVSPFFGPGGRYRMRLPAPGDRLALTVVLERDGARVFTATLRGTRAPAAAHPFTALTVSARIRLQGIRLYLRGLPVIARPRHRLQEDV
ncbi:DUF1365 domain-containing protein [Dactylosporangium vinaceum]|uniref:DUF1365 domain-containing protein n=1 Tax=Dactylosporangium vinaceum TaxID=53362 RepID=A0ABV5MS16_9ACTN|nr:DUF1365 domain-containing protein [Dactylosporangium vinaceum]